MAFNNKVPEWNARGSEPPQSLKDSGFAAGYKPPAAYFNWFWHGVSACLAELQESVDERGTYTDLSQIGLSSYDFLSSDFKGNISKIADAMQWKPFAMQLYLSNSNQRALYNSLRAKLKTDLGIDENTANNYHLSIHGQASEDTETGTILIDVADEAGSTIGRVMSCVFIRGLVGDYISSFTYSQHPSGFVPVDGSIQMTGSLKTKGYGEMDASNTLTYLKAIKNINNFRYLRIINPLLSDSSPANYPLAKCMQWSNVVNGSEKTYNLHGEHNKPGGIYSGNGSETKRTVETGGIGYCILIWRDGYFAFVTALGAMICNTVNKTATVLPDSAIKFIAGTLTIATTDVGLNGSGKTYSYQVL